MGSWSGWTWDFVSLSKAASLILLSMTRQNGVCTAAEALDPSLCLRQSCPAGRRLIYGVDERQLCMDANYRQ